MEKHAVWTLFGMCQTRPYITSKKQARWCAFAEGLLRIYTRWCAQVQLAVVRRGAAAVLRCSRQPSARRSSDSAPVCVSGLAAGFRRPVGPEGSDREGALQEQRRQLLPDGRYFTHLGRHGQVRAGAEQHAPRLALWVCSSKLSLTACQPLFFFHVCPSSDAVLRVCLRTAGAPKSLHINCSKL